LFSMFYQHLPSCEVVVVCSNSVSNVYPRFNIGNVQSRNTNDEKSMNTPNDIQM
jgi:hypothetical protein